MSHLAANPLRHFERIPPSCGALLRPWPDMEGHCEARMPPPSLESTRPLPLRSGRLFPSVRALLTRCPPHAGAGRHPPAQRRTPARATPRHRRWPCCFNPGAQVTYMDAFVTSRERTSSGKSSAPSWPKMKRGRQGSASQRPGRPSGIYVPRFTARARSLKSESSPTSTGAIYRRIPCSLDEDDP
jgi:hypothetical protein